MKDTWKSDHDEDGVVACLSCIKFDRHSDGASVPQNKLRAVDESELDLRGDGCDGVAIGCSGGSEQCLTRVVLDIQNGFVGDDSHVQLGGSQNRLVCTRILIAHLKC